MGWFGSLGLAFKYALVFGALMVLVIVLAVIKIFYDRHRLKKFSKKAELEAQGAREERVELNARELDEGDLFGIRAIQSGYFGGVAQSRPVSPVRSHSPEGSTSNTLLGSRPSPKLVATTPMSSVTVLPLDARQSSPSPLGHDASSLREGSRSMATPRRNLTPVNPRLQPSEAELSGRINHDPVVNMSLEIPPSPLRPSGAHPSPGSRSPSPSYPFPIVSDDHRAPSALRPGKPQEIRGYAQQLSHSEMRGPDIRSQSGSIVSRSTTDDLRHDGTRSPSQEYRSPYEEYPARPYQSTPAERPLSDDLYYPTPSSSGRREAPPAANRPDEVAVEAASQVGPAVSDWRSEIFHEINQSLKKVRSNSPANVPPQHDYGPDDRGERPNENYSYPTGSSSQPRYIDRASTLSDASSTYSSTNPTQRHLSRPLSPESKSTTASSTFPSFAGSEPDIRNHHPTVVTDGSRRGSGANSHHPAVSSDTTDSGSHRNTRELGDFYDSYWRQSTQGTDPGRPNQSGYVPPRGTGELGKDGKRPGQLDFKVDTIAEVDTPLASPMPGTAL